MKTQFVLSATAACLCVASCSSDPALAEKKKSVSIGRFGVTQNLSTGTAVPPAPGEPAAAETAPAANPSVAATPAPEPKEEKKSGGFFSWFRKKDPTEGAPAAAAVQEKPAQQTSAVAKEEAPAEFREPARNKPIDDDIRIPNMLGLPEDKDLKATNPTIKKDGSGGAVISSPPVEKKN